MKTSSFISFSRSHGPVMSSLPSRRRVVHPISRDNGLRTIAVTGFGGGAARAVAEVAVHVDCTNYGVVEDLHQAVMHALAQYVRQLRMTSETISASVF
jgi:D-sedoheptulose 7-phosphate isomerase/D-glycero-D-manno-heptose 1,7-bisphosphate phosphatase